MRTDIVHDMHVAAHTFGVASLLCPELVAEPIVTHSLRGEDGLVLQAPLLAPDLTLMAESEGEAALAHLTA